MIQLTKLDKSPILVNLESIKYIEKTPDSLVFFNNGDKLLVLETLEQIQEAVIQLQRTILHSPPTEPGN